MMSWSLRSLHLSVICSLIVCGCAIAASSARAGSYPMFSCEPPGVIIAKPTIGPWRVYSDGSPGTQNLSDCGVARGGAMVIAFNGNEMPAFGHAGWELPAAALNAGVGIVSVRSWARGEVESPPQCSICWQVLYGENLGPNAGKYPRGADPVGGYASPPSDPPAGVHRLGLACGNGGAGAPCRVINRPNLVITGLATELTEGVAPEGSITGGALASPGTKAGAVSLSYSASDGQSGIERVEVLAGDRVVGTQDFSRNVTLPLGRQTGECTYTGIAACPLSQSRDIPVDTTAIPNGVYPVRLRIIDAADNRTDVAGPQVTFTNSIPGTPNGSPASRLAKLTARFATTKKRTRRLSYRSRPLIRGRLVNEAKQPISGATVAVLIRAARAGARAEQVDTVTTAADGRFSYRLGRGPSRRVTFAYTAFAGDPRRSAARTLRALVRAQLTASATPRSPAVGAPLVIGGRLRYLARSGVQVTIQVRTNGRWRPIGNVKTTARGRYTWRYRFVPAARGRSYTFRVHVDSPIYPFAAGNSKPLRIRVR